MVNINLKSFKENIDNILKDIIKDNKQMKVLTENGNVVILSEQDYNGLIETVQIESIPGLKEEILARNNDIEGNFEN